MDSSTNRTTSGQNRNLARADARAWSGYVPRQASYLSSTQPSNLAQSVNPTLAQSSEAAQRLVLPLQPAIPDKKPDVSTTTLTLPPIRPQPLVSRTNSAGSFDMLPPSRPPVLPAPITQTQSVPAFIQPAAQVPTYPPKTFSLPTDLPSGFKDTGIGERGVQKHGKFKFSMPKLSVPRVITSMAVIVFLAGGVVSIIGFKANKSITEQVKGIATQESAKQDEDGGITEGLPNENGNAPSVEFYRTASTFPRVLRINKLSIESRVLGLSIAPTGALKSPANIFDLGWYKDSAKPGEIGAMIINGHESGPTRPGIFENLGTLKKGDAIEVERGDGMKYIYTVTATKEYEAENLDMSSVMVPSIPGKPGLNILTSAGKFDPATNKFEKRTVVYAVIN